MERLQFTNLLVLAQIRLFPTSFLTAGTVTITSGSEETIIVSSAGATAIPAQTIYYPNGTIRYTTDTALTFEPNGTVFAQNGQICN